VNGEVAVAVNDNSAGNDKVIVSAEIETVADLVGKTVALEEGVVGDFLLTLALEEAGQSRDDVNIENLETGCCRCCLCRRTGRWLCRLGTLLGNRVRRAKAAKNSPVLPTSPGRSPTCSW
jgi:hypothetical protein